MQIDPRGAPVGRGPATAIECECGTTLRTIAPGNRLAMGGAAPGARVDTLVVECTNPKCGKKHRVHVTEDR